MMLKSLMKNPMLMVGILCTLIFLSQLYRKGYFDRSDKLNPTSCKAVLVKLDRRIPANWKTSCDGNTLIVKVNFPKGIKVKDSTNIKTILYREMANNLKLIATNSPSDNLERTDFVVLKLYHDKLNIGARSEGRHVVKLATINNKNLMAQHLNATVQVREKID